MTQIFKKIVRAYAEYMSKKTNVGSFEAFEKGYMKGYEDATVQKELQFVFDKIKKV